MLLSKENRFDFEYELKEVLGFVGHQFMCGYKRTGNMLLRVKDHTPDWDYFREDIEDGITNIVNITIGDYNNTDRRRSKGMQSELLAEYPRVTITDIFVQDESSLTEAIEKIKSIIK